MYAFTTLTEQEIQFVAENLSEGNKAELALHLGVKTENLTPRMIQNALNEVLRESDQTFKFYVSEGRICGIGGVSKSGAISFVIIAGLTSNDYICMLRDARTVMEHLYEKHKKLYCWADSRNIKAKRWFRFAGLNATGARFQIISAEGKGINLNYYEYVPLAESKS